MKIPCKVLFSSIALVALAISSAMTPRNGTMAATDPVVKLRGIDGQNYDFSEMPGNVMLVSFGATWCVPCAAELRALEELKHEYAGKPVKFFWVSIEGENEVSNAALKRYAKERKLTIPVLRDPTKSVYLQFTQRVRLPMILFFNKEGHIDGPTPFGLRSPIEFYKADVRARLNKLLS